MSIVKGLQQSGIVRLQAYAKCKKCMCFTSEHCLRIVVSMRALGHQKVLEATLVCWNFRSADSSKEEPAGAVTFPKVLWWLALCSQESYVFLKGTCLPSSFLLTDFYSAYTMLTQCSLSAHYSAHTVLTGENHALRTFRIRMASSVSEFPRLRFIKVRCFYSEH